MKIIKEIKTGQKQMKVSQGDMKAKWEKMKKEVKAG